MTWVGASARILFRLTDFVPPTFGIPFSAPCGWMQKPVRPTSSFASPSSQTSSVMDGTSETILLRADRRAACAAPLFGGRGERLAHDRDQPLGIGEHAFARAALI